MRDWFFYAVWATRIKTAIKAVYETHKKRELKQQEIKVCYKKLQKRFESMKSNEARSESANSKNKEEIAACLSMLKHKLGEEEETTENDAIKSLIGVQLSFRLQNVTLNMHSNDQAARCVSNVKKPVLELQLIVRNHILIMI